MALTQKQQLWSKEWEFHWKKTYSLRKDSVHRLLDTRLLHSMGPGQGWKHHNYSKTQLPTSRTDPKQFCLGCFSQHNTQQRQQATEFPGRQLMEGSTMNEKRCSHLQSFHSSRYAFLRWRVTCCTSRYRLKNEDTVMRQGFVSHVSFGPRRKEEQLMP